MLRLLCGWMVIAGTALSCAVANAEAPGFLPVQGQLSSADGTAVNGTVGIRFRLYDRPVPTGATTEVLYEEQQQVVVKKGAFTAYLGDTRPLDLELFRSHSLVFLGMRVEGDDAELSPLLQLGTAPYAAYANSCGDADTLGGKTVEEIVSAASQSGERGSAGGPAPAGATGVLAVRAEGRVTGTLQNQTLMLGFQQPYSYSRVGVYNVAPNGWTYVGLSDEYKPPTAQICQVQAQAWFDAPGLRADANHVITVVVSFNGKAPDTAPLDKYGVGTNFVGNAAGYIAMAVPVTSDTSYRFGCALWNDSGSTTAHCRIVIVCM